MLDGPEGILTPGWSGHRIPKACILGLGLIGGSWAGALYQSGWEVFAVDPEKASIDEAVCRGWIQGGWTEMPPFLEVDLVVLALPLQMLAKGYDLLLGRIPKGTIVTDVGSIKTEICNKSQMNVQNGSRDFYFVGGHPMTGSEQSGFGAANPNLFRNYPYVLTPAGDCPPNVVQKLVAVIQGFGAKAVFREPRDHDVEVAMVSHIPHLLAVALALATHDVSQEGGAALALAGRSFRELTRIADSSPEMWKEIMVRNSDAILGGLTLWEQRIQELRDSLQRGDGEAIAEAFRKAHVVRGYIN
ncbi:prephenate dehydrogenase/arogenate dehydrogenase family protein [Desulfosporosinus fructosivorans]|uniref:Prephenate dehydrogenase/arogenate dehydrogenase family protein n=1 Tax=Desulfosporosinus fructosivorans TaxID=2018669 RepID=A0A4Z0R6W9_9FIRM|nr:prephenate dehydrogenase/arogenate dehydrogenase family protein [Desulfosporosinus fructosivorans]TGE37727.1 prephenate dehydrogenase/arogenate dehydrogenase family protein [Desulfosporosinus fructosivorans]